MRYKRELSLSRPPAAAAAAATPFPPLFVCVCVFARFVEEWPRCRVCCTVSQYHALSISIHRMQRWKHCTDLNDKGSWKECTADMIGESCYSGMEATAAAGFALPRRAPPASLGCGGRGTHLPSTLLTRSGVHRSHLSPAYPGKHWHMPCHACVLPSATQAPALLQGMPATAGQSAQSRHQHRHQEYHHGRAASAMRTQDGDGAVLRAARGG